MPTLQFKGRVFVENHDLAVPFHELRPVRSRGLSEKASLHDNLIIEGDNLAALKALLPTHQGKVKCIYIDSPYNTGNEGWAYNDNVNSPMMQEWLGKVVDREDLTRHDKWCCMMLPRLKLLRELLRDDGAIFVSIDDNEVHHLRCLMDEVFGEASFIASIVWQKMDGPKNTARHFSEDHDFVLVYARNAERWRPNLLPRSEGMEARYKNPDNDPRGPWLLSDLAARNYYAQGRYSITTPSGKIIKGPPAGSYWRVSKERFGELERDNRIWWGKGGSNRPGIKRFFSEVRQGVVPQTLWMWKDAGSTRHAKQELSQLLERGPSEDIFITPKPTKLLGRILQIASDKDSIILDSFAGSATTAHAVLALNREDGGNRRFVLVECEDYVQTLTAERVRRAVKGVPNAKNKALASGFGGSFSYFQLGAPMRQESLLDGSNLPDYETLAGYVFFTATAEEHDPAAIRKEDWFVGRSSRYDV
ncbi:MAG: site-specific DNA-methyltransferase, partial [Rhodospirillales bacterium]|nr:site-specific DNA-methyltransferase [Rhodospirillales bacterium]